MARDPAPLVYSTDGSHRARCAVCGRQPCICPGAAGAAPQPAATPLRVGLERKGRGGKAVTQVQGLEAHGAYAASLLKELKAACGAGGALKEGVLEVQGDQRARVQAELERRGFPVKRAGG
jgi:translation initiation factor 1